MGEDLSEDEGFEDEEDLILGEEDMRRQEAARMDKIAEEESARSRQVHDPEKGIMDFGKMRATDAKRNTRVILPSLRA